VPHPVLERISFSMNFASFYQWSIQQHHTFDEGVSPGD